MSKWGLFLREEQFTCLALQSYLDFVLVAEILDAAVAINWVLNNDSGLCEVSTPDSLVNVLFNSLLQIIPEPGPPGLPGPMVGLCSDSCRFIIVCDKGQGWFVLFNHCGLS